MRRASDPTIIDAEYEVVSGPYRFGEEHRKHRGWFFIGRYDADGWPLFMRRPNPWPDRVVRWFLWACAGLLVLTIGRAIVFALTGH